MPTPSHYRGRFAPSPTGPLHFGSLLAAFGSWLLARHSGGEWWVRIEDLDPPREVPGAATGQLDTLAGFGLTPDAAVAWQGQRSALYQAAMDRLLAQGQAFHCHCSRSDLTAHGGVHRRCVARARRADPAIRFRVDDGDTVAFEDRLQGEVRQDVAREVGDFVLRRADGCWAYQLAVVVDDGDQGMTDIVRGADLLDSTPRQILLQRALGLRTPRYLHLPLIVDRHGHKLSKSAGALRVDAGDPLPTLRAAWRALGQDGEALNECEEAATALRVASARFDPRNLPRVRSIGVAALHNMGDSNAG
jgi:glutamyl-Q tRNA(Asp) synthetase